MAGVAIGGELAGKYGLPASLDLLRRQPPRGQFTFFHGSTTGAEHKAVRGSLNANPYFIPSETYSRSVKSNYAVPGINKGGQGFVNGHLTLAYDLGLNVTWQGYFGPDAANLYRDLLPKASEIDADGAWRLFRTCQTGVGIRGRMRPADDICGWRVLPRGLWLVAIFLRRDGDLKAGFSIIILAH